VYCVLGKGVNFLLCVGGLVDELLLCVEDCRLFFLHILVPGNFGSLTI